MKTKSVGSLYTNVSTDGKWIVDEFKDLVEITKDEIPVQYDPETGECLGVLCEPPSKNHYPTALDMSSSLEMDDGIYVSETTGANSILFFPQAIYFDQTKNERFVGKEAKFTFDAPKTWFYVGVSFFVRFPNGGDRAKYGRSYMEGTDFHVKVNGLEAIEDGGYVDIKEMNDGSYWVRARLKTPSRPLYDISIGNGFWQRDRDFLITGLQIEPYMCTSPIITDGVVKERDGNYIQCDVTKGQTINPTQGTLELGYSLYHGSVGSALSASSSSMLWELGHIGEWQDNHENEDQSFSIRVDSDDQFPFEHVDEKEDLKQWNTNHRIRFTYGAYGHRYTYNDSLVYKHKDSNRNEDIPTTFNLGISDEGNHINGHIHYFDIIARALIDEEMVHD